MSAYPDSTTPRRWRVAAFLFPPLGLWPLWRRPRRLGRKLLGTAAILVASLLYAGLMIVALVQFTGLKIEWRGGYIPALTWQKTGPNYDALERDRNRRVATAPASTRAVSTNACWPGFRGPQRDGVCAEDRLRTNWPASGLPLLWRQPIGGGYGSFAIAQGLAFTLEQRRDEEVVVAYQLQTGREAWTHAWKGRFKEYYSEEGPRSTPAYSDGSLYAAGALGELRALEAATGRLLWARNILAENQARTPSYGVSASPLIVEEKLIVLAGASAGHCVVCYDKRDGKPLWSALDDAPGYASPIFVTLAGQPQLIVCANTRTVGLRLEDGKLLWEYPWRVLHNQSPIAQPVLLGANRFLLSAGYFTGCAAVEVTRTDSSFAARTVWQNQSLKNKFTSSVFWQGHIYGLDEDTLTCLDAETGARKWRAGRYGYGQLLLAGGYLIVVSGDGAVALVRASPGGHQELGRFQAIRGKTWNHLALADARLLVRNAAEMACVDLDPPGR